MWRIYSNPDPHGVLTDGLLLIIAYFSAALLVTTSCFLSTTIGIAQLVVETTSRRISTLLIAIFQLFLF
jgi:hypothetical protein